jgi:hypothetical protein
MAQGWIDTYDSARRQREERELKARREGITSAQPEEFQQYTEQQGQELSQLAESGQVDIGYDQGRGAYTVTPRGLSPEARTPNMTSVVAPQSRRSFLGQDYAPEDLTPERVQRLREQAMVDTIADPLERQRGLQGLRQAEAADLQLSEAKSAALLRENTQKAQAIVAEQIAAGQLLDVPALSRIAADTGADAQELIRGAASALNLTNAQAEAKAKKLVSDINKAATSPEAFNKLLGSFDPNPDDNILPELRIGKDGMHQVFYGDKPMSPAFRGTKDISAMSLVASHYSDQVSGNPLATAVQLATLDAKRAQIRESNRANTRAPDINEYVDAQGNLQLIDVGRLPRDAKGQPILPQGLRRVPTGTAATKDLTPAQERAFDVLKSDDRFKTLVARGDQAGIRAALVANNIPPEAMLGEAAAPPGGGTMDERTEPAPAAAQTEQPTSAAPAARAAPAQGLTREQVGQAVAQQQGAVQAEFRVRRDAITAFEQDPRVRQAYETVRQLRRSGEAVRANNIENQIAAQREQFIQQRVGGER